MIKKRYLKYDELEEYVVVWALDQLEEFRDMAQEVYGANHMITSQKKIILQSIARQIGKVMELLVPMRHDQDSIIKWSQEFIREYGMLDQNDRDD